jgi:hypothetical protein
MIAQTVDYTVASRLLDAGPPLSRGHALGGAVAVCPRKPGRRAHPASIHVAGIARPIRVKFASRQEEFEQAFRLLTANYQARGYDTSSPERFRFTPYHVLPDTTTVVALDGDQVVATLSLVPDTRLLGLPMEGIYGEEIERLRGEGRRLAEWTSLAGQDLSTREFIPVFTAMIRLTIQHHLRNGGDAWVMTVNPRHSNYYRRVLGFVPLGPRRTYPAVQGHPAEAFLLDVPGMAAKAPATHRAMLGEPLPEAILTAPRRSPKHSLYFGQRSTQAGRRTIRDILHFVEGFGSPPRWLESRDESARGFALAGRNSVAACG